jgi:hypothetical protein
MSVLAERFEDPALGELVRAYNALGIDAQQHVDAVPGPLGHLGRVDAAVEPCGQAGVPEVYGRRASGEACSVALRAVWRALIQARR